MTWVNQALLEQALTATKLIELTDDTSSQAAVNTTNMNYAINLAAAKVQGALKKRYPTQVAAQETSLDISEIVLCLAVRNLYGRRKGSSVTRDWGDRIGEALGTLKVLGQGKYGVAEWDDPDSITITEHKYPESESIDEWEENREEADF